MSSALSAPRAAVQAAPPSVQLGTLLQLAWPLMLMRAAQSVIGLTDALMVAPLGQRALAAVTTGALNVFTALMLPLGIVTLVQTFAAQMRGAGDEANARKHAWYGLIVAAFTGLIAWLAIPALGPIIAALQYPPELAAPMRTYLEIRMLGVPAVIGMEAIGAWYSGLGNTRVGFVAGLLTVVANIAGNYLLIEPRFGLPGYGVTGAAWASTLASCLGFLVAAIPFVLRAGHAPMMSGLRGLRVRELMTLLRVGGPNGASWLLEFAAFTTSVTVVAGHLGTELLAAVNVAFQIYAIAFLPAFGLTSAGAILIGAAIGSARFEQVHACVRVTLRLTCGWMLAVSVVYWTLPGALVRPFGHVHASVFTILTFMGFCQLADAFSMTIGEALRAAGDTAWCMRARIACGWLLFVPAVWATVFVFHGGVHALMGCMLAYAILQALAFAMRFASGAWRFRRLLYRTA